MRTLRGFLVVLLVAPLAGAVQPYQPPEDGVELRIENFTDEKFLLAHLHAGTDTCSKAQSIGEVTRNLATSLVPGQVATISLRGRRADISDPDACSVYFTFRPEAGHSYRASLQMYDGRCRLGFGKVELSTNSASAGERVLRKYRIPLLPMQGVCAKLDATERAKLGL